MPIPQSHIDSHCTKKKQYPSREHALRQINKARKSGRIICHSLRVYKCSFCPFYHIGHVKSYENGNKKEV